MSFDDEIKQGERFDFGKNWEFFLEKFSEEQLIEAEKSLQNFLEIENLKDLSFIDVGSGSGLMSLAAKRLGAIVYSFDYDPSSVWCTEQLRSKYNYNHSDWTIEEGSILDDDYVSKLSKFDIVYSWGVLHHTGNLEKSLENISRLTKLEGKLFIAIYNDQGKMSDIWRKIKRFYCESPLIIKKMLVYLIGCTVWGARFFIDFIRLKPFESWKNYHKNKRGMSPWSNIIDWVGGYPFEVAKPELIFDFFKNKGFTLCKIKTVGGRLDNNQYVFRYK